MYSFLLIAVICISFFAGCWIDSCEGKKRRLIEVLGVIVCLSVLFVFKYLNFFAELIHSVSLSDSDAPGKILNIIMPLGISYYIFRAISYIIDVYNERTQVCGNFVAYALFVSFFPTMVAGPIERSTGLLGQLLQPKSFKEKAFKDGILLLLFGLLKKMVLADNFAVIVNNAFSAVTEHNGMQLLYASVCYSLQIYFDFSACADMAVGSAKLFGIDLIRNFQSPYFSTSIKEFWRRWHISLSTWFRDYVYISLGGNRKGKFRKDLNTLIVFVLSGIWHGPGLGYIAWGLLHGIYQLIESKLTGLRSWIDAHAGCLKPLVSLFRMAITFVLVTAAWVFFRMESLYGALDVFKTIGGNIKLSQIHTLSELGQTKLMVLILLALSLAVLLIEKFSEKKDVKRYINNSLAARYILYFIIIMLIVVLGYYGPAFDPQEFIYFKY